MGNGIISNILLVCNGVTLAAPPLRWGWIDAGTSRSTFVWTIGFLLGVNINTLERQLFFSNIGYLGTVSVLVAW